MKIKMYFYHEQYSWEKNGRIGIWTSKINDSADESSIRVYLAEQEIEIPELKMLTEMQVKQVFIEGLKNLKKELQAETHVKMQKIDDKIQQLLCIEMKPEEV
jgi:hypothetical protein